MIFRNYSFGCKWVRKREIWGENLNKSTSRSRNLKKEEGSRIIECCSCLRKEHKTILNRSPCNSTTPHKKVDKIKRPDWPTSPVCKNGSGMHGIETGVKKHGRKSRKASTDVSERRSKTLAVDDISEVLCNSKERRELPSIREITERERRFSILSRRSKITRQSTLLNYCNTLNLNILL